MDIVKLAKIKEWQREYERLFGEKLIIDFELMAQNKPVNQEEILHNKLIEFCATYDTTVDNVVNRDKRIGKTKPRERKVLVDYSLFVFRHNFGLQLASEIIKRDRTAIYYYAYKKKRIKEEAHFSS